MLFHFTDYISLLLIIYILKSRETPSRPFQTPRDPRYVTLSTPTRPETRDPRVSIKTRLRPQEYRPETREQQSFSFMPIIELMFLGFLNAFCFGGWGEHMRMRVRLRVRIRVRVSDEKEGEG